MFLDQIALEFQYGQKEAWNDTTGEYYPIELIADGKNVLINAGDPIPVEMILIWKKIQLFNF